MPIRSLFTLLMITTFSGLYAQEITPVPDSSARDYMTISRVEIPPQVDEIVMPVLEKGPFVNLTRFGATRKALPTPVEVLDLTDGAVQARNGGNLAYALNTMNGLQMQTSSAGSNGSVLRIHGLPGRHTQLTRDGFPVFGGLAGSFDLLQISPLDLRQIEVMKGPASTFYGNGAIAGAVNLVSGDWKADDEPFFYLNASSIGTQDLGLFASHSLGDDRNSQWDFSTLAAAHLQSAYDPDGDGFTDLPLTTRFNFNPRLRGWFNNYRTQLQLNGQLSREDRRGGDLSLVKGHPRQPGEYYLDWQESTRFSTQLSLNHNFGGNWLVLRSSLSWFDRQSSIQENPWSPDRQFDGRQFNQYSELYLNRNGVHGKLRTGLSFAQESFVEGPLSLSSVHRDQQFSTLGAFVNHLWRVDNKLTLESGLRVDYANASSLRSENGGQVFYLPRLSALFQPGAAWQFRLGGGFGYRMPSIFDDVAEPSGYRSVVALDFANVRPERSQGADLSIRFQPIRKLDRNLTLEQRFFYTQLDDMILWQPLGAASGEFRNYDSQAISRGFETNLDARIKAFQLQAGYTRTDVYLQDSLAQSQVLLVPEHSLKGSLSYFNPDSWRITLHANWRSTQLVSGPLRKESFLVAGATIERFLGRFSLSLNAENVLDARQSRFESMASAPYDTPQYTQVWAPLTGFYLNGGLKIKL